LNHRSGESTQTKKKLGHNEADFWEQVADGREAAEVRTHVPTPPFRPQGSFSYKPERKLPPGFREQTKVMDGADGEQEEEEDEVLDGELQPVIGGRRKRRKQKPAEGYTRTDSINMETLKKYVRKAASEMSLYTSSRV
jgi:hypothetical protein